MTVHLNRDHILFRVGKLREDGHTFDEIAGILSEDPLIGMKVTLRMAHYYDTILKKGAEPPKKKRWTRECDRLLRKMYKKRVSISAIMTALGRTRKAVIGRAHILGIYLQKITEEDISQIAKALNNGKSVTEISCDLGICHRKVLHAARKIRPDYKKVTLRQWGGSYAERQMRTKFQNIYGDFVIPPKYNRILGKGRFQIDIPIVFPSGQKFAVEINSDLHKYLRGRDELKKKIAKKEGWVWLPIWYYGYAPNKVELSGNVEKLRLIIDDYLKGNQKPYSEYIASVTKEEEDYYDLNQPAPKYINQPIFGLPWSSDDENILLEYYGEIPVEKILELLSTERTINAVRGKACSLGITKKRYNFTDEEKKRLSEIFYLKSKEEILLELSNRTWPSLYKKAYRMGLSRRKN